LKDFFISPNVEKGIENCAIGLKKLMPIAEKHKVTIVMELLNAFFWLKIMLGCVLKFIDQYKPMSK